MTPGPLFYKLDMATRARLAMYQWNQHRDEKPYLDLPLELEESKPVYKIEIKEATEEFDALMRETPKRMRRVD